MQRLIMMSIVAAIAAGCTDAVVGPVDHSCHSNPGRSQGSGCEGASAGVGALAGIAARDPLDGPPGRRMS